MEGVVKLLPLPIATPPIALVNQLIVPLAELADKLTVPVPHLLPPDELVIGIELLITALTMMRVAVVHEPENAST
jgi:hypothetical protein